MFVTARQLEERSGGQGQQQQAGLVLGQKVNISAFKVDAAGARPGQQPCKQYTLVLPALRAKWDAAKQQHTEAERPFKLATAVAAGGPSTTAHVGTRRPMLPGLSSAAAAAGGTVKPAIPTFKKIGAAAAGTQKAAAVGQKRAGGTKAGAKPAAPKRAKAATAPTAALAVATGGGAAEAGLAAAHD